MGKSERDTGRHLLRAIYEILKMVIIRGYEVKTKSRYKGEWFQNAQAAEDTVTGVQVLPRRER